VLRPAGNAGSTGGLASGGSLTVGSLVNINSFDPAQAHLGHQMPIYQAAYDTLILRKPDGTLAPMLATKWEYNADNTARTVNLRTDVTFSDGTSSTSRRPRPTSTTSRPPTAPTPTRRSPSRPSTWPAPTASRSP
jgi:ABC-type transport system substrate-binding protein